MISTYDPDVAPLPSEWLALHEVTRIDLVTRYHARNPSAAPAGERAHAVIHVAVESQLAEGIEPVTRAFDRVQQEGLSRHDAIHAIGSVLAAHLNAVLKGERDGDTGWQQYLTDLQALQASEWRAG